MKTSNFLKLLLIGAGAGVVFWQLYKNRNLPRAVRESKDASILENLAFNLAGFIK